MVGRVPDRKRTMDMLKTLRKNFFVGFLKFVIDKRLILMYIN